jgi:hypothetical protein
VTASNELLKGRIYFFPQFSLIMGKKRKTMMREGFWKNLLAAPFVKEIFFLLEMCSPDTLKIFCQL